MFSILLQSMAITIVTLEPVCTANIGRSKPFEIITQFQVERAGLHDIIRITSSGTSADRIRTEQGGDDSGANAATDHHILSLALDYFDGTHFMKGDERKYIAEHVVARHPQELAQEYQAPESVGFYRMVRDLAHKFGKRMSHEEVKHRDAFIESYASQFGTEGERVRELYRERGERRQQTRPRWGPRVVIPMAERNLDKVVELYATAEVGPVVTHRDIHTLPTVIAEEQILISLPYTLIGETQGPGLLDAFGKPGAYERMAKDLVHVVERTVDLLREQAESLRAHKA